MKNFLYGIDFGTTNSALAIYDENSKEIHNTIIIPSLIYFYHQPDAKSDKYYVVGEDAIAAYLNAGPFYQID